MDETKIITPQQKYYLKNKDAVIQRVKEKRMKEKNEPAIIPKSAEMETQTEPLPIRCIVKYKTEISPKPETNEIETQTAFLLPHEDLYVQCIKDFINIGDKYVSIVPAEKNDKGLPIFFIVNEINDDGIIGTYCDVTLWKLCGNLTAIFETHWDKPLSTYMIYNKDIFNIRRYDENEKYTHPQYHSVRDDYQNFYKHK